MVITHFGNGCFRVQSGETSLLINPENNRLKADIVLRTLIATSPEEIAATAAAAEGTEGLTIAMPGEYEEKDIEIVGFPVAAESTGAFIKTAYVVRWEGMKLAFLGHLSAPLDASLMEELAEPHVLILPVGGGHFLEPEPAAKAAKQLEARIIIPSFYKDPAPFLKALGVKGETMDRFTFKPKDIADDKGRAIVLSVA
jgi:L-ascorbate metabolism protein UlaG (beta-lactamase superfamily)